MMPRHFCYLTVTLLYLFMADDPSATSFIFCFFDCSGVRGFSCDGGRVGALFQIQPNNFFVYVKVAFADKVPTSRMIPSRKKTRGNGKRRTINIRNL